MTTKQFKDMTAAQAKAFMPKPEIQEARARAAEIVGKRMVIDLGCGKGDEVSSLYTKEQYLGVDVSPELIRLAEKQNPGYAFECCDILDVRGRWSCGVIKAVLEHLPPREAIEVYEHARGVCRELICVWHTEPGIEKLSLYQGELGEMQQNRHDRRLFRGVHERIVLDKHVIWCVDGL